jgi:hypothetical protein
MIYHKVTKLFSKDLEIMVDLTNWTIGLSFGWRHNPTHIGIGPLGIVIGNWMDDWSDVNE